MQPVKRPAYCHVIKGQGHLGCCAVGTLLTITRQQHLRASCMDGIIPPFACGVCTLPYLSFTRKEAVPGCLLLPCYACVLAMITHL